MIPLRSAFSQICRASNPIFQTTSRHYHSRGKATMVNAALKSDLEKTPSITSALPAHHLSAKVVFDKQTTADFKYIWLRDNCRCSQCMDASTKQKLIDTPLVDVNIKPKSLDINDKGHLEILWEDSHVSSYESEWLYKYGRSFMHNTFETDTADMEVIKTRPEFKLWDRTTIWSEFPELSYKEFAETESGLRQWLEMFYKYGVAVLRGVPPEQDKIKEVVNRFAYIKETQYGQTFDVVNVPQKGSHLAFSGVHLAHHTDMNYREKSPGMQLLHCLKANNPSTSESDPGGKSFFVDGFKVAEWLEDNEPAAFHVLTSTPVRFSIKNQGQRYSALWPVICTNADGDVTEIHHNNRTMQPLQAPTHVITPFYHAYKMFSQKLRDPALGLEFNLVPGDLVAFNNRRTLHGRTSFDASVVDRKLQGCYVDIDEAFSKFDQLQLKAMEGKSY